MLSYQHAYHAGHAADVAKHAVLAAVLHAFTRKAAPVFYAETHAGRGFYPLGAPEATKTRAHETGLVPLLAARPALPPAVQPYVDFLGQLNPDAAVAYPGSPAVAHACLRADDRLVLCEAHPGERAYLQNWAAAHRTIALHGGDGHAHVPWLLPPPSRRAVVLIDPAYELKTEYAQVVETAAACLRNWPQTCVIIWYPILPAGLHEGMLRGLKGLNVASSFSHVWQWAAPHGPMYGMQGSGQAVLNLPYGLGPVLDEALATLATCMHMGAPVASTSTWLHAPR